MIKELRLIDKAIEALEKLQTEPFFDKKVEIHIDWIKLQDLIVDLKNAKINCKDEN